MSRRRPRRRRAEIVVGPGGIECQTREIGKLDSWLDARLRSTNSGNRPIVCSSFAKSRPSSMPWVQQSDMAERTQLACTRGVRDGARVASAFAGDGIPASHRHGGAECAVRASKSCESGLMIFQMSSCSCRIVRWLQRASRRGLEARSRLVLCESERLRHFRLSYEGGLLCLTERREMRSTRHAGSEGRRVKNARHAIPCSQTRT